MHFTELSSKYYFMYVSDDYDFLISCTLLLFTLYNAVDFSKKVGGYEETKTRWKDNNEFTSKNLNFISK